MEGVAPVGYWVGSDADRTSVLEEIDARSIPSGAPSPCCGQPVCAQPRQWGPHVYVCTVTQCAVCTLTAREQLSSSPSTVLTLATAVRNIVQCRLPSHT